MKKILNMIEQTVFFLARLNATFFNKLWCYFEYSAVTYRNPSDINSLKLLLNPLRLNFLKCIIYPPHIRVSHIWYRLKIYRNARIFSHKPIFQLTQHLPSCLRTLAPILCAIFKDILKVTCGVTKNLSCFYGKRQSSDLLDLPSTAFRKLFIVHLTAR